MGFVKILPSQIEGNVFHQVGKQWMLVTAGNPDGYNTMTASWGQMGILWGKNVATCYVRPSRHTYDFMEKGEYYTLSFYGEEYRDALNLCGTKSGRDMDKPAACGLEAAFTDQGAPYFTQAELVLVCRKMYTMDLDPAHFLSGQIDKFYDDHCYHRTYIGEIVEVLRKEESK